MAKSKKQNKIAKVAGKSSPKIDEFEFWRELARLIAPDEKDEWRVGEIATAMQQSAKAIGAHWEKISSICDKTEGSAVSIGFNITIDRTNQPQDVSLKISYSEKFGDKYSVKVPNPSQTELPLNAEPPQDPE